MMTTYDNYKFYDKSRSMFQLISRVDYGRLISPEPTLTYCWSMVILPTPSSSMTLLKIMIKIPPCERSVKQNG